MQPPFEVLYEDNHLLVVNKPAGWVSQGALPDAKSLLDETAQYIRTKYQKPGNVFLGVVSRLDKSVSGVTVIARTSKAAARLSEQFRDRDVGKIYWAIVSQDQTTPLPQHVPVTLNHWLLQNEQDAIVRIVRPQSRGAKEAILKYTPLAELAPKTHLLQIELLTGRKHQIRAQLAHVGLPIIGDRKYGSPIPFHAGIMLHAVSLQIQHPTQKEPDTQKPLQLNFTAPLPKSWLQKFPKVAIVDK
jgi:23S rRNA pseudouridine1911/1915/1917 synthase